MATQHSSVDVDFFDPQGVQSLRRSLSRPSDSPPIDDKAGYHTRSPSGESQVTLNVLQQDNFDFKRALRTLISK